MSNRSVPSASEVFDVDFQLPLEAAPIWAALVRDARVGVMVADPEGLVRFVNTPATTLLGREVQSGTTTLHDLWDEAFAKERLDLLRECAATGRVMAIDGMIRGRFMRTILRPLSPDPRGRRSVLMVFSPASPRAAGAAAPHDDASIASVVRAQIDDPGQLGALTSREVEILRLIGAGLSTADIAKRLHRSVKTIEWHRVSLGNKLGVTNRVELARIAIGAGLVGVQEAREAGLESTPD